MKVIAIQQAKIEYDPLENFILIVDENPNASGIELKSTSY